MKKLSLKELVIKYRHVHAFAFLLIYFPWFGWIEKVNVSDYYIIHVPLDDMIPFCEVFVIPYLIWFAYMFAIGGWLIFADRREFYRFSLFIYTGMLIFLILSSFWHNGQDLRPDLATLGRDNIFIWLTDHLIYGNDTPTNICPSIHVYNTLGAIIMMHKTKHIPPKYLWVRIVLILQGTLIIMSTVFLKQHSVVDVISAFVMAVPVYFFAFKIPMNHVKAEVNEKVFIEK